MKTIKTIIHWPIFLLGCYYIFRWLLLLFILGPFLAIVWFDTFSFFISTILLVLTLGIYSIALSTALPFLYKLFLRLRPDTRISHWFIIFFIIYTIVDIIIIFNSRFGDNYKQFLEFDITFACIVMLIPIFKVLYYLTTAPFNEDNDIILY